MLAKSKETGMRSFFFHPAISIAPVEFKRIACEKQKKSHYIFLTVDNLSGSC